MARPANLVCSLLIAVVGVACSAGGGSGDGTAGNSSTGNAGNAGAGGPLGNAGSAGASTIEPPSTIETTYTTSCEAEVCTADEVCLDPGDGNTYCCTPCPGNVCTIGTGDKAYCTRDGACICSDK
jgi:hypothetical protein